MSKNIFITGTGTNVGKTYVTGLILKKLNDNGEKVAYYKAAMSGNKRQANGTIIPGDALYTKTISGIDQPLNEMCPYIYDNAMSPHLASRIEGNPIDIAKVIKGFENLSNKYDYITMEGSGGIICPLCFDELKLNLEDIIKKLNLSCIIIANAGLGTINYVTLTVNYMQSKNIPIKGIILNHFDSSSLIDKDNLKMCEYMTGIKVLACVKDGDSELNISYDLLKSLYE